MNPHLIPFYPRFQMVSLGCFVLFLVLASVQSQEAAPSTTARPAVSEDALNQALQDKRYLMRQLKCALGEAPCDPVGRRLKSKCER